MEHETEKLIEQLQSGTDEERKKAALALGAMSDPAVVEPLEAALKDKAMGVRYFARKSLGKLRNKLKTPAVSTSADHTGDGQAADVSKDDENQVSPSEALEELRGLVPETAFSSLAEEREEALLDIVETNLPVAGQAVAALLAKEENPRIKATAVKALARLMGGEAVKNILPYLKDDDDRVRANTVEALQITADPGAVEHIVPLLNDENHRVRGNATRALHEFGQEVIPVLTEMLEAPEEWMRVSAAHALGFIDDDQVYPLLWQACDDANDDVREMGYMALLKMAENKTAGPFLQEMARVLEDTQSSRQRCALRIRKNLDKLSESGDQEQKNYVLLLLADLSGNKVRELAGKIKSGSDEERKEAVLALGDLVSEEALQLLEETLQDTSRGVRYFARKSLAKLRRRLATVRKTVPEDSASSQGPVEEDVLEPQPYQEVELPQGPDESTAAILEQLLSENVEDRMQALTAIADSPSASAVDSLVELLAREEDTHVRATAVKVLALAGGKEVSGIIAQFLRDEDHRVRANAVEAVEITGDLDMIGTLVPLLEDEDHRVRANTARALHAFGMHGVLPVLDEMLLAAEESMRISAAHALGFLEDEGVYTLLWKACEDESPDVQKMAFDSLIRISDRGTASLFFQEMAEAMKNPDSDKHAIAQKLYQKVITIMERGSLEEKNLALKLVDDITYFLKENGAVDLLIEMYSSLVDLHPDARRLITLGNLFLQKGDLVNARIQFDRYLALDPGNVPIRMKLGEISFFVGELDKAEEEYSKALKLSPDSPAILYKAGEVRFLAGKYQEAVSTFQRLLKMETSLAPHAHNLLGLCFIKMAFPEMADREFNTINFDELDISENQMKEMLYRIAAAYRENGYRKEALEYYKRIMVTDVEYRDVAGQVDELKNLITRGPSYEKEKGDSTSGALSGSDVENLNKFTKKRYSDIAILGEGGMGRVYQARDTLLDRQVAIKLLPMPLAREKKIRDRFTREARAAARMSHPNIVQIYDVNPGKFPFFIMEFVKGKSFRDLIKLGKVLAPSALKDLVLQIAEAFQYAHDRGVIHRDIKPDNIMLDFHGQVKIMDFGLAKMEMVSELTQKGEVMGTVYYMSPEQIRGQKIDSRSDIYSFGVTLYEIITRVKPFRQGNIMYEHLSTDPESPSKINPSIPKAVEQAVLRCLEKDPDDRYLTFRDFIQDWLLV